MASIMKTRDDRLDTLRGWLTQQTGTLSKAKRQLEASRPQNLLFGASLHAAARQAGGLPLSPLEESLVNALRTIAADDDEIAEYGKVFTEMKKSSRSVGSKIFPEAILSMDNDTSYTNEDYIRDGIKLAPEFAAMPTNAIVDLSRIGADGRVESEEHAAAVAEAGYGVTVFTGPERQSDTVADSNLKPDAATNYKLNLMMFQCLEPSGDTIFGPSDEIYWCTAFGADGRAKTSNKTIVYGSVKEGTRWEIVNYTFFEGAVENCVTGQIQVWEKDSGGVDEKIAAFLKDASDFAIQASINATSAGHGMSQAEMKAAAIMFFAGAVAGLLSALISWATNKDDFVAERDIAFTKSGLQALLVNTNEQASLVFRSEKNGSHELWFKRVVDHTFTGTLLATTLANSSASWTPATGVTRAGKSLQAMGLAVYDSKLVGVFHAMDDTLQWTSCYQGSWDEPRLIRDHQTKSPPSLAAFKGLIYCVYRDTSNYVRCINTSTMLDNWELISSTGYIAPNWPVFCGPSLAEHDGKLFCVMVGLGGLLYWTMSSDGTNWAVVQRISISEALYTEYTPALCSYNGSLYCIVNSLGKSMCAKYTGTSWEKQFTQLQGIITSAPAAAVHDNRLWVTQRGTDCAIWFMNYDGKSWNPQQCLGQDSCGQQGLGSYGGMLWCVYGKTPT